MKTGCSSRGNWRPLPSQKPWLLMAIAFATVLLLPLLFKFHIQTASGKVPSDAVALNGEIQRPKVSPTTAPPPRLDRPVTVVTAYYNIPSKHSNAEYLKWIGNFLPRIPCYMYLFTDEKSAEQLIKLRAPFLNRTIFVVRPFAQLKEVKRLEMWKEQHKIDHERHYQSPQVYAVWNEKVHFLREAAEENAFDSDYFLWTDIGSFRDADRVKHLTTFPDTRVTATLLGTKKIFFLQMGRFTESDRIIGANGLPKQNFQHHVRLGAGIFGGHLDAVREYHARFFETLEKMRLHGIFVGKEQNVMSSVAVMYPQLIKLVDPQPYLNGGDAWFYSQYYFSKRNLTAKELE